MPGKASGLNREEKCRDHEDNLGVEPVLLYFSHAHTK
jgi:hypothetical protein